MIPFDVKDQIKGETNSAEALTPSSSARYPCLRFCVQSGSLHAMGAQWGFVQASSQRAVQVHVHLCSVRVLHRSLLTLNALCCLKNTAKRL